MVNKHMRLLNEDESKLQLGDGDSWPPHLQRNWMPVINEILSCSQEHGNSEDRFAVSVIKDGDIVGLRIILPLNPGVLQFFQNSHAFFLSCCHVSPSNFLSIAALFLC